MKWKAVCREVMSGGVAALKKTEHENASVVFNQTFDLTLTTMKQHSTHVMQRK